MRNGVILRAYAFYVGLFVSGLLAAAEAEQAEVLFSREPERREGKTRLAEVENFFYGPDRLPNRTEDEIRKDYAARKWGSEVVKVELRHVSREKNQPPYINQDGYLKVKDGTPYIRIVYLAEVLYESSLTPDQQARFTSSASANFGFDPGTTADGIKQLHKDVDWRANRRLLVAEIRYGGVSSEPPYIRPYLWTKEITGFAVTEEQKKLNAEKAKALHAYAIGQDCGTLKYIQPDQKVVLYTSVVQEAYSCPRLRGGGISVTQTFSDDFKDQGTAIHKALRSVIRYEPTIETTPYGHVLVTGERRIRKPADPHRDQRIVWVCEDGHIVEIISSAGEDDHKALLELYAKKFNSVLPKNCEIDPKAWSCRDIEETLKALKDSLKNEVEDPLAVFADSHFYVLWDALEQDIRIPFFRELPPYPAPYKARLEMVQRVEKWWSEVKADVVWNSAERRLILPEKKPSGGK
ncbi:MAG TPA: hypothetical protein VEJ63_06300 [Planctomycetota bacterium]|nr:hypothetical protein [Planctomycetota bacterium]